ncbi:stage 0 sporulation protein [Candidatus Parcubacteria bacterium]|nr:stage 0 sporulation protein [Candidatus Parcubacteria bacterium]
MKISAKILPWDNPLVFDSGSWDLAVGDIIIVNVDSGIESGVVEKINIESKEEVPNIARKATIIDLETIEKNKKKSEDAVKICRNLVNERKLAMKIVNARFSFDGGRITFSFIAEKRVDFRDLVKNLSKKFQRSIRLQQIGSRDEARGKGGFGICGRELCCIKFSGNLKSVTTEDAKVQQMGQRGSERLSGLCGRLKCCLGFESEQYRKNLLKMPKLGEKFMIEGKEGRIVELDVLENKVIVEFKDKNKKKVHISELKS